MEFDYIITDNDKSIAILTKEKSIVRIGRDCPINKHTEFLHILNTLAIRIHKERIVYAHFKFTHEGKIKVTFSVNETGPEANDVTYVQEL